MEQQPDAEIPRDKKRLKENNDSDEEDKNQFSNDGSFLELFKRRMKEKDDATATNNVDNSPSITKAVPPPPPATSIKSIQV